MAYEELQQVLRVDFAFKRLELELLLRLGAYCFEEVSLLSLYFEVAQILTTCYRVSLFSKPFPFTRWCFSFL